MPEHKGPDLQEDRHRAKYDYVRFMEQMTQGGERSGDGEGGGDREGDRGEQGRRVNGHRHGVAREGYWAFILTRVLDFDRINKKS